MALKDERKIKKTESCPFQEAMDLISGKWTMSIINVLMGGKMRFKELERSVVGINTRMLVKELKQLEHKKIIDRTAFATMPPTVEYALTEKGERLKPVLTEIQVWAIKNMS
ncbi:winged helix-turn-helix transcriptional regulator [Chitinophaga defluvii]|uniref:Helix-turn-helix domain-containing protein n=1 Tax=Chitinophaga defluvii TaxID=3163343 RepID=A0ABV2T1I5_9BACT